MTAALAPVPGARVLEVGTGAGYQAAVLAELGAEVHTVEIVAALAEQASQALDAAGYGSVQRRVGDGHRGWPEAAPFGAIVVTAAPRSVPQALFGQLVVGGRLVIPVGPPSRLGAAQDLWVYERSAEGLRRQHLLSVRFVPMTGVARDG